jgi:hypothetical protein
MFTGRNPAPDPDFILRGHTAEITSLYFAADAGPSESRRGDEWLVAGFVFFATSSQRAFNIPTDAF